MPASEASPSSVPTLEVTSAAISNARRWTIIALLFANSVINYVHRGAVSVALPMISRELKISPLQKGWLLWAFFVSYALMQIPVGRLVDRFNLRWLVGGMFVLWCLSCGLMGLAGSLATLLVLRILLGFGDSMRLERDPNAQRPPHGVVRNGSATDSGDVGGSGINRSMLSLRGLTGGPLSGEHACDLATMRSAR